MPQGFNLTSGTVSHLDSKRAGEEVAKRRKVSSPKLESETSTGGDDFFTLSPCLVTLGPGVRITSVAAGGRHTLALSGKTTRVRDYAYDFQDSYSVFVVTPYSFVGCRKYEAMEDF